ncbi:MAG: alanine--glyoxylate aminotransferase family protein [Phycisphaerae bacterium]|nr:alanine--glyoxylate aminotransferase family protein [Phycisphaerae bacterium]
MAKVRLYTPGPTPVPEQVQLEIAQPMIHHRTKEYQNLLAEATKGLQYLFRTQNDVLTFTSSGTGAMEGAIVCCAQPGKKALVARGGKFGERWGEVCEAFGIDYVAVDVEWGHGVDPKVIEKHLSQDKDINMVIAVHSETSTAAGSDIEAIAKVVAKTPALFMVDAISSAGAMPIKVDEWGIDIVVTGSQKALMLPPGLAFASVSEKAWKVIESNKPKAFYFDYRAYRKALKKNDAPYTPALTLVRGLHKSLQMIQEAGIENVWKRCATLAEACRQAFVAMNLKIYAADPADAVTGVWLPEGVDESAFRKTLQKEYGVNVAGGQAELSGKIFRMTHMGYVDSVDTMGALAAIEAVLLRMGHKLTPGAGLTAAQKVLTAS